MIAIYVRVSTEEQVKNGFSLQDQVRACRKKALDSSSEVIEYRDEGFSGEFLERPALLKLRIDLKKGLINKVICLDPDRLSRKLMNQLIISEEIEKKAELIFVNGEYARTPEGMLFYQMRGAVAEFEKAKITERMSRGRREKARQGRVLRDFQIYGYSFDKEQEQLIIHEEEAKTVQLIFSLFTSHNPDIKGINGIATYLTKIGVPTKRRASKWHRQVVRQILMNRAYIGEFYQNRWNTEGMLGNSYKEPVERVSMKERPRDEWILLPCPPILENDQFVYAQLLLEQSRRRWSGTHKRSYFLSGLLRCGACGNTMTGRRAKNWDKYELEYTDKKNTAGMKNKGCGLRIKCTEIDEKVWDGIANWLNSPKDIEKEYLGREKEGFQDLELERLDHELIKIKAGTEKILSLLVETEDIGVEDIRQKLKELKKKESFIINKIESLQIVPVVMTDEKNNKNLLMEAIKYYLSSPYKKLNSLQKKEILRIIVKEIIVYKDGMVEIHTF